MNEKDSKIVILSGVLSLVFLIGCWLVGNQPVEVQVQLPEQKTNELGGGTRFPNGISADSISPSAGEVRGTTVVSTGDMTTSGDLIIGEANSIADVIYLGAGDGCTALYASASTTLTAQATSTAFCN